ncbi:MAG: hypothetical protein ACP5HQ_06200 [Thermoprotei archaeon]
MEEREKEIVLKALEKVEKWYVHLAGISGDMLLIVSKREVPQEIEVDGKVYKVKHYDPEAYLEAIRRDENEFRSFRVYYFLKVYMRKVLDLLAQMEVERMSLDLKNLL